MLPGQGQSFKTLNQYKHKVQDIKNPKLCHNFVTLLVFSKEVFLKKYSTFSSILEITSISLLEKVHGV